MEALIKQILLLAALSSVMLAAVLLLRRVFHGKLSSGVVSLLWLMVMVRLLVPITFNVPFRLGAFLPQTPTETAVQTESTTYAAPSSETEFLPITVETVPETTTVIEPAMSVSAARTLWFSKLSIWQIAFVVWAAGAVVALMITIRRIVMFAQKIKKRMLLTGKTVAQKAYLASNRLGIYRTVFVYECEYIDSPITCGVIRPKIVLPAQLIQQIGASKTGLILFHELVHVKRQDVLKNYLWLIAKIVYWFNPLVYLGSRAYLEDIEIACDEVVKKKHSRDEMFEYSQGLLDVIRLSQGEMVLPTAISFCKDTTKIRKRVENMLKPRRKSKLIITLSILTMMVFAFGCFTTACMPKDTVEADAAPFETPIQTESETEANETEDSAVPTQFTTVGGKKNALAVVKAHNLTGTSKFSYGELRDDVLPYHVVKTVDGTSTRYEIYDFNGEIRQASIEANFNEDEATISEEEAKAKVQPIIDILYDDVELTVTSCALSRGTSFDVAGTLYKPSEGSTREFRMTLNGDGEFCSILAPYDEFFVLNVPEDLLDKARSYSQIDDFELSISDVDIQGGDEIYTIVIDGVDSQTRGDQIVKINASDLSLVEYTSRLGRTKDPLALNDAEIEAQALKYIAEYFPQVSGAEIVTVERAYSEGSAIAESSGFDGQFYVSVWADGSIETIMLMDAVASDLPYELINDEAINRAKDDLYKSWANLLTGKEVTCIRIYKDLSADNRVVYELEYKSDEPSARDYSFIAEMTLNLNDDSFFIRINPILDELDILTMDEAIEKARQIVAEKYDLSFEQLQNIEVSRMDVGTVLCYEISFLYDHTTYGATFEVDSEKP